MLSIYLPVFLVSLLIAYLVTPLIRRLSYRLKIFGGLAIYIAFIISMGIAILLTRGIGIKSPGIVGILFGGTIILVLGLVDDSRHLLPRTKLIVQGGVSIILILSGIELTLVFLNLHLNIFFTVFWIVLITNAFYMIDTLDGLSAGVAFIILIILFYIALQSGNILVAVTCAALAGATLGFLRYNFKPGTIRLGNAGSLFLGFIIAAITLEADYSYSKVSWISFLAPLLILGLPIYEAVFIPFLQYKKGTPVIKGSPNHFVFRLLNLGIGQKKTLLLIYLTTSILGLAALMVINLGTISGIYIFLIGTLIGLTIGRILTKIKV